MHSGANSVEKPGVAEGRGRGGTVPLFHRCTPFSFAGMMEPFFSLSLFKTRELFTLFLLFFSILKADDSRFRVTANFRCIF